VKETEGKPLTEADYDAIWKMSFTFMDEPVEKNRMGASLTKTAARPPW
jgi:hypothetical protein